MARLVCPSCGRTSEAATSRFCDGCGMPLVPEGDPATRTEAQQRARKINPSYTEGRLVKVGWAHNQSEAELIAGLLLEEGIPGVIRRSRGFDVPDFLAGGPRDILVAVGGADAARDALGTRPPTDATASPTIRGVALAMLVIVVISVVIAVAAAMLA